MLSLFIASSSSNEIIAAIQNSLNQSNRGSHGNVRPKLQPRSTASRGMNLRTTDGQPLCNNCNRVGHVARYCWARQNTQQQTQQQAQPNIFRGIYRNVPDQPNQQSTICTIISALIIISTRWVLTVGKLRTHGLSEQNFDAPKNSV